MVEVLWCLSVFRKVYDCEKLIKRVRIWSFTLNKRCDYSHGHFRVNKREALILFVCTCTELLLVCTPCVMIPMGFRCASARCTIVQVLTVTQYHFTVFRNLFNVTGRLVTIQFWSVKLVS